MASYSFLYSWVTTQWTIDTIFTPTGSLILILQIHSHMHVYVRENLKKHLTNKPLNRCSLSQAAKEFLNSYNNKITDTNIVVTQSQWCCHPFINDHCVMILSSMFYWRFWYASSRFHRDSKRRKLHSLC